MSIEHLRRLALAEVPTNDYPLCLNPEIRMRMVVLTSQITAAKREAEKVNSGQPSGRSMADEDPATTVERLTAELEAVYEEAKPDSIVLVFRRLAASRDVAEDGETAYSTIERRHTNSKSRAIDMDAVADDLLPACYERAESADGEDVGLTWLEVKRHLDQADIKQLRSFAIGIHHTGAAIPFDPRTFGQPATT